MTIIIIIIAPKFHAKFQSNERRELVSVIVCSTDIIGLHHWPSYYSKSTRVRFQHPDTVIVGLLIKNIGQQPACVAFNY